MDNAIPMILTCNADSSAHGICDKISSKLGHRPGMAVRSKARGVFRRSDSHSAEDGEQIAQSGSLYFQDLLLQFQFL